jgi:hypothetical protein
MKFFIEKDGKFKNFMHFEEDMEKKRLISER